MISRNQIILTAAAVVVVAAGVTWTLMSSPTPPSSVSAVAAPELLAAIEAAKNAKAEKPAVVAPATIQEIVEESFERIGLNTLKVRLKNATQKPLPVNFKAGEVFDSTASQVVLLRSFSTEVPPGGTAAHDLRVAATKSTGPVEGGRFTKSSRTISGLAPLIRKIEANPEIPTGVAQAAVLAITEDAPADLFARFPRSRDAAGSAVNSFKLDTVEMIAAIQLLRDSGLESTKLASDPQLKVEAMIDPTAHASAMKYFGIESDSEWQYWRRQLLEGDPSMRHYALYGIARFYPDVALQMMPKWALEQRTLPHYRRAAIGALALTRKSEAGPLLRFLERELVKENDLAQNVGPALRYLEQNINDAP